MRRSPEIIILAVLLFVSIAGILWYVVDRRAKMRAEQVPVHAHQG